MKSYRTALIGCSRMGAFIDNEVQKDKNLAYSHAAGYESSPRTQLVALSDSRADVMAKAGERYGVTADHQYKDYREMLVKEAPDIVSVATQPEHRAKIVLDAVNAGIPAIYAEKAMAASLSEANDMVAACQSKNVFFNLGTNRRWDSRWEKAKEVISSGQLGTLKTIISHWTGTLFNSASHMLDLMLWLHDDQPVEWLQGFLREPEDGLFEKETLTQDPVGEGIFRFSDGVYGYALNSSQGVNFELVCSEGSVGCREAKGLWEIEHYPASTGSKAIKRTAMDVVEKSSTQAIIEDLVRALDTGNPPRGGVQSAYQSTELIFAFIESHLGAGKRICLPLQNSTVRLTRNQQSRQPKYQPGLK